MISKLFCKRSSQTEPAFSPSGQVTRKRQAMRAEACLPFALTLLFPITVHAATGTASATEPNYADEAFWLCRADKKESCAKNVEASTITTDGKIIPETWRDNPQAPVDCFYVYPTVSNDRRPNSDLDPQADAEWLTVRDQLARFGSHCRLFAPIYRQRTLPSLRAEVGQGDNRLAYGDVKAAWQSYLKLFGAQRGVVLIGHSQGADHLKKLIQEEIDTKPMQARLVSAILLGTPVMTPIGKDVGGDFKSIAACRSATQTGCVISYASFRKTMPPPTGGWYGRNTTSGMAPLCTNPASLAGGSGVLKPYFASVPRGRPGGTTAAAPPWLKSGEKILTPYVTLPDLLAAQCVQNAEASYLEVSVRNEASSPRTNTIQGDIYKDGKILPQWGLHVIDMHLAIGNLMEIVAQESKAYLKR